MKLSYLPSLDGIRACAFAMVFVAHAGLDKLVPGGLGVTVFFFLSGYLITTLMRVEWAQTEHISLRNFYKRRALRILPPLYIVLAIGWSLDFIHIPMHRANGFTLTAILFYFYNYSALLHPVTDGVPLGLNVVWSLMIEEHFYLIFPFVYLFIKKRGVSPRSTVIMLSWTCAAVLLWRVVLIYVIHTSLVSGFSWTYAATDARFDSILWGCILAIGANPWCGDKNAFFDAHSGRLALGGVALLLFALLVREPHFRETLRYTLEGIALLPIFYYIVSAPDRWQTRWLTWRPLRWIGWVSYTMYLTHFMLLQILRSYLNWHPLVIGVCAAVLCGLCGETIRRTVENPLRQRKRRAHLEVAVSS